MIIYNYIYEYVSNLVVNFEKQKIKRSNYASKILLEFGFIVLYISESIKL